MNHIQSTNFTCQHASFPFSIYPKGITAPQGDGSRRRLERYERNWRYDTTAPHALQAILYHQLVPQYPKIPCRGRPAFRTPAPIILHPYFFRHFSSRSGKCRFIPEMRPTFGRSSQKVYFNVAKYLSLFMLTRCRFARYNDY